MCLCCTLEYKLCKKHVCTLLGVRDKSIANNNNNWKVKKKLKHVLSLIIAFALKCNGKTAAQKRKKYS